jgi:hypothetical protein
LLVNFLWRALSFQIPGKKPLTSNWHSPCGTFSRGKMVWVEMITADIRPTLE